MADKKFAKGFIAKRGTEKAHWVLAKISIKKDEAIKYLQELEGEWVNLEISKSEKAKYGASIYLDEYKPDSNYQKSNSADMNLTKDKNEEEFIPPDMPDYDIADQDYKDYSDIPF